ncbi:MAG TPA: RbsD/FucU domain-containing protein [Candidatus Limiplasma sp.]|nr:RbsD/FucU domain-containing protein [Candidatus Limiplasma sp.]
MLKNIPDLMPPELMKILMEMGHGDELLLCDGNYPKFGCPERCVRMDGHGISEILDMILTFFPLDAYVENPVTLMAVLPNDPYKPEIWEEYRTIGKRHEAQGLREKPIDKYTFYEQGQKCFACIATSERALYANVILKKGVVK